MRGMRALAAGVLAVVGAVTGCGSSDARETNRTPVAGPAASDAVDPNSDLTAPTTAGPVPTTGPPSTLMGPTPPATISIELPGTMPADRPGPPPTTAPPRSFPLPEPLAAEYQGEGRVIETDGQARLAFGVNSSYPPSVWFGIPLVGWDWDEVDGESVDVGTVWTDAPISVVGAWDGTRLTLTRPPSPAADDNEVHLPDGRESATPGCELADAQSAVASDEAAAAGLAMVGPPYAVGGDCFVYAVAVIDNPELRAVLAHVGDRVRVDYLLRPAA